MTAKGEANQPDWSRLRLPDYIRPGLRILLVGINPGVQSAIKGHHFAGPSNRFWKLLIGSGLIPEPIGYEQDARLLEWGIGITNLISRPSPGIDDLTAAEYSEGWRVLDRKIRRYRPRVVAFVGVTLYRRIAPLLEEAPTVGKDIIGLQPVKIHGSTLFVLPNPSGRNANFTYGEMLRAFSDLQSWTESERVKGRRAGV